MDFSFSKETEDLRQEIRQFIKENPPEAFPVQGEDAFWGNGGYSYEYTRKMGEAGWLSLTWPKEWGGRGRTILDKMVVAEELSYCRAPTAFNLMLDGMSNHIISHGNDYLKSEILPKIAQGSIVFWLALSEPNAGSDLLALQTKAEDKGEVDRGWAYIEKIISNAALLKSAEMLGGSRKTLDMCVEYMKVREQFGQALGNFQAVQHKCAEMLTDVDLSRNIVYKPAWMIDQGMACDIDIAMAKAWTSDAYRRVAQTAFQLFGAMAFCEEHDMHLYLRHAKSSEINFGDSTFQRNVIADHLFA